MRRTSVYYSLRFIVQCQSPSYAGFESIAAFDNQGTAIKYAADCTVGRSTDYRYRVVDHANNEDKCVYRTWRVAA